MKNSVRSSLAAAALVLLFGAPGCSGDEPVENKAKASAAKKEPGKQAPENKEPAKKDPAGKQPETKDPTKKPAETPKKGSEKKGKRKYGAEEFRLARVQMKTYCATCHGAKGKGDGPAGLALNPKPRDWTEKEWQDSVTDQHLFNVIKDGGGKWGKSPMMAPNPKYGNQPKVIWALVDLVRKYGK